MNENIIAHPPIVTEEDLARQGFTVEQIQRLVAVKERYPLLEFVTSRMACERLAFLRWYYRSGRIVS